MKNKLSKIILIITIVLFFSLQIYNFGAGNKFDLVITLLIVVILLGMVGVYYLIRKKQDNDGNA